MINYQDYFEETMYGEFYYSEEEYQKDCFAWLDMCLGGLIERKGGVDASFPEPAEGLPITHEEMRRLLDKTPPDEQVQEQIYKTNEEIRQELVKALIGAVLVGLSVLPRLIHIVCSYIVDGIAGDRNEKHYGKKQHSQKT